MQLAYDGTGYLGWQKTSVGRSVEGVLSCTLEQILQHKIKLQAASRTDRGVHALGQIVNFFTDKPNLNIKRLKESVNELLPNDIQVVGMKYADDENFHPTLSAKSKEYHYLIAQDPYLLPHLRFTHWHFPYPLDLDLVHKACECLVGTKDFKTFCNQRKNLRYEDTVRTLFDLEVTRGEHNTLRISLTGDHFLYKMARNIVGTLIYVGAQKIPLDELPAILEGKKRQDAGITAPAHGLTLYKIYYTEMN